MFITIKKKPTVFARNGDLFVVVHTFETHLYLISEVTTARVSPPVCLLFMNKVHSIAGGGNLTNSGADPTPAYLI